MTSDDAHLEHQEQPGGITRRSALGLLGAAGAVAAGATLTSGCETVRPWSGILAIGTAYCVAFPAEADPATLEALLGSGIVRTNTPPTNLYKAGFAIKNDFAAGRTVMLSGWVLSRTEARVCALWYVRKD